MALIQSAATDILTDAPRRRGPLRPAALASSRRRIEATALVRLVCALATAGLPGVPCVARAVGLWQRRLGGPLPVIWGPLVAWARLRSPRLYSFPAKER